MAEQILDLLQLVNREQGKTIVMVTHDPKAAERASRQLHLDKGRLMDADSAGGRVKFFHLVWAGLWRNRARTVFTLLVDRSRLPAFRAAAGRQRVVWRRYAPARTPIGSSS